MPTTSNFGWTTPADTDLVKDGAAAIRTLGNNIDASLVDLKGGTTGQVLAKASNTDLDFTWSSVDPLTILDAKGDLITATAADTPARLASSGVNGDVLTVDTSTSTGLKWAPISTSPTFVGCRLFNVADVTIASATTTALSFDSEAFDTDNFHSTSTNTSRITIPAGKGGYYLIEGGFVITGTTSYARIGILRNGSTTLYLNDGGAATTNSTNYRNLSFVASLVAGDYIELVCRQQSGSNQTLYGDGSYPGNPNFQVTYLGA